MSMNTPPPERFTSQNHGLCGPKCLDVYKRQAYDLLAAYFPDVPDHPGIRAAGLEGRDRYRSDFENIVRVAARRNVRVHTIDSRGLYASENFAASSRGSVSSQGPAVMSYTDEISREAGNSLAEIAEATGGLFIHNTNDLLAGMRRVFADGRDFYILSYVSKNSDMNGKMCIRDRYTFGWSSIARHFRRTR